MDTKRWVIHLGTYAIGCYFGSEVGTLGIERVREGLFPILVLFGCVVLIVNMVNSFAWPLEKSIKRLVEVGSITCWLGTATALGVVSETPWLLWSTLITTFAHLVIVSQRRWYAKDQIDTEEES